MVINTAESLNWQHILWFFFIFNVLLAIFVRNLMFSLPMPSVHIWVFVAIMQDSFDSFHYGYVR